MNEKKRVQKIKELRSKLFSLRKERDALIFEKGLIAQDNKDLRENAAFQFLEMKEHALTQRIYRLMAEINDLVKLRKTQNV
jgi:hypothetical protein